MPASRRVFLLLSLAAIFTSAICAQDKKSDREARDSAAFFDSAEIPVLKIILNDESQQRLRDQPREYTRGSLVENDVNRLRSVGVKLKGAAGSYRDFDDRPGLTLNINKYKKGQRFHGMEKFHLNNAVQDETFLNEWLGSAIFREAGYPAPRVGHVHLWINDRDMGLYVLREAFDGPFFQREFSTSKEGKLYDCEYGQDIDSELQMDIGDDIDDRGDIAGLAAACSHPAPEQRWMDVAARLDMDQFLTFMALERLCGHWDGYTLAANNYRLYFPSKGRAVFLPHGMDQIFGDPGAGLYDHTNILMPGIVMQNDRWRQQYRERLIALAPILRPADRWLTRIDEMRERLKPVLESVNPDQATAHGDRINELKDRFAQRAEALPDLLENGEPQLLEFDENGLAMLPEWEPSADGEEAQLREVEIDGVKCLSIHKEPFGDHASSWRRQVVLPRGDYRFEARVKTENVLPIPDDHGRGAGIGRISFPRENGIAGSTDWQSLTYDFQIPEDRRVVELALELRARHGQAWFDSGSVKLLRVQGNKREFH